MRIHYRCERNNIDITELAGFQMDTDLRREKEWAMNKEYSEYAFSRVGIDELNDLLDTFKL